MYNENKELDELKAEIERLQAELKEKKSEYSLASMQPGLAYLIKEKPLTNICLDKAHAYFDSSSTVWCYIRGLACNLVGFKNFKSMDIESKKLALDFINDIIPVWNKHFNNIYNCTEVDMSEYKKCIRLSGRVRDNRPITEKEKELLKRFEWINETEKEA